MSKKKQVTFADIAEYTNFSKTTISRYFNHPDSLTLENQEKISQALDTLGYKKNKLAKVLANGKSEFIGIIVPNLYLHYYSEMLTQFLSSYRDYHYKFLVFVSEHGAEEEQQYIEELLSYQIEGLIVLSHTLPSEKLASYQIPVIAIEREAEHISSVNTDNYMGALQATSLLIRDKCDILIHINVNVNKSAPAYDTEIMCDHDDGCLIFLLQILDNIENLSLNCHIERGRRLVTDQNFRITGKCNRDHNTLTHTAGKFVRILSDTFFRLRDADHAQHLDSLLCRFLFCHVFVTHQIFHNLFSDTHRRI